MTPSPDSAPITISPITTNPVPTNPVTPRLRWFSRRIWEPLTTAALFLGFAMLFQPFWLPVYSASFGMILFGVLGFVVAGRLPE